MSDSPKLRDFKGLSFDCYGTLIDWETGMLTALQPLRRRLERQLSDDAVLQAHAKHESRQQAQTPTTTYRDLLAIVYRRLSEEWKTSASWDECVAYGESVSDWPAFDDSVAALSYLKKHYRLIILSNVDNHSFAASNDRLNVAFDAVYTAEDIGSYKPAVANFDYMLSHIGDLDLEAGDILHTAESLFHDHGPANRHGLANCWIHRGHEKKGSGATMIPGEMPTFDFQFNSMAELVAAHKAEQTH